MPKLYAKQLAALDALKEIDPNLTIEWDEDTRKVIEKDQADEDGHINRWKALLESA